MRFLEELASRRRFGMKPGLDTIRSLCSALGEPQRKFRSIHVAGTNGKGAVCAIIDAWLRSAEGGRLRIGRYTSPHLVKVNERFFLDGRLVDDWTLERISEKVGAAAQGDVTFFEALTAVAFCLYAEAKVDYAVMECGLGGRLDATNVCEPAVSVITRIGLDHCDWLGNTLREIATEKAGIIKSGVPIVLGRNEPEVVDTVRRIAASRGASFAYAPEIADQSEVPADFPLAGAFNRENAVTALAALRVMFGGRPAVRYPEKLGVVWPGRFQRIGSVIVDGAHNPPAARALASALDGTERLTLIAGFCGDKDVDEVLRILKPFVCRGIAVKTNNPRSLTAEETAAKMCERGIAAVAAPSLKAALALSGHKPTLVCGSLFLAGEALVELDAYPWGSIRFDAAERLRL